MKRNTLAIANAAGLAATLFINYAVNDPSFAGATMKMVSDRYYNLFTPAGYAFVIWGFIYLFLLGFVIYSFVILKRRDVGRIIEEVGIWFLLTCILNCAWIFAWLNDHLGLSVVLMSALLLCLLRIIINTRAELTNPPLRIVALVWWPFSFYSGWITVALIANIAAYLTKIQWDGFGLSEQTWAIIMIAVAVVLYIFMTWMRNMREYALVGCWGLIAIAVANRNEHEFIFWTALVATALIAASSMIHAAKNFRGFGKTFQDYES